MKKRIISFIIAAIFMTGIFSLVAIADSSTLSLSAEGTEDGVELSWIQTGYATLLGFNIYRSTSASGMFEKINTTLVPGTIREYTDTNVSAGTEYYYYFTVVGTNSSESESSNVVSATPIDTVKPTISHERITAAVKGQDIVFDVLATDNIGVESVNLYYRAVGDSAWLFAGVPGVDGFYSYTMSADDVPTSGLEYYIEVSDGNSTVREGSANYPIRINIEYTMGIYSVSPSKVDLASVSNGITATLWGVNFSNTMTLTVDGKNVAYNYVSDSQITFTVPAANLGRSDILLTDGTRIAKLTNAITYTDSTSNIEIVSPGVIDAGVEVKIPVNVSSVSNIYGIDVQLTVDKSLFSYVGFEKASGLTSVYSSISIEDSTGKIKISLASSDAIPNGTVGYLVLTPKTFNAGKSTTIDITSAKFNAVSVGSMVDCDLEIYSNFTISGYVKYYSNNEGIEGVKVTLSNGMITYTDENGYYAFTGITQNSVTVTPSFSGNINNAISAQDAALILQAITGEGDYLTDLHFTVADVDGDRELTSLDAAYILQKNVGKLIGNYPGTSTEWEFIGTNMLVIDGGSGKADFTGILLGDVTGDWTSNPQTELD